MSDALLALIPAHVPQINRAPGIRPALMEVMDTGTGEVWMSVDPVSAADVAALVIEPHMVKYGPGVSSMDIAWFDRSPGADADGSLAERQIGGRAFRLVARPGKNTPLPGGVGIEMMVDKHHNVGFAAGREIEILINPEGLAFVEQIDATAGSAPLVLPPGFSLRRVKLAADWLVRVPRPARVYFFFPQLRSYQGPIADIPA